MPGLLDGFALARRAREFCPGIPIIYSTGYPQVAHIRAQSAPYGVPLALSALWRTLGMLMKLDDKTASGRRLNNYEVIAAEPERITEMVRNTPELNHHAAEPLLKAAQDIRSDLDRVGRAIL